MQSRTRVEQSIFIGTEFGSSSSGWSGEFVFSGCVFDGALPSVSGFVAGGDNTANAAATVPTMPCSPTGTASVSPRARSPNITPTAIVVLAATHNATETPKETATAIVLVAGTPEATETPPTAMVLPGSGLGLGVLLGIAFGVAAALAAIVGAAVAWWRWRRDAVEFDAVQEPGWGMLILTKAPERQIRAIRDGFGAGLAEPEVLRRAERAYQGLHSLIEEGCRAVQAAGNAVEQVRPKAELRGQALQSAKDPEAQLDEVRRVLKAAVRLYTREARPGEEEFYAELNRVLRQFEVKRTRRCEEDEDSAEGIDRSKGRSVLDPSNGRSILTYQGMKKELKNRAGSGLWPYTKLLIHAIRPGAYHVPGHPTIWRGQRISGKLLAIFERGAGKFCLFTSFMSFTTKQDEAERFAEGTPPCNDDLTPVLFGLEWDERPLVQGDSSLPGEGEVILHPGSIVKIDGCEEMGGFHVIKIKDVPLSKIREVPRSEEHETQQAALL